jgi:ribosomal protein L3
MKDGFQGEIQKWGRKNRATSQRHKRLEKSTNAYRESDYP